MNKKIRKILIIFFFLAFIFQTSNASLLWDLNYGINQYRRKNFKIAKEYLIQYTKENPNDENGFYWLAKTYHSMKDTKNANENFKKAYELTIKEKNIEKIDFNIDSSTNVEDYFDMAAMYFEAGNLEKAENYADLMLNLNPKSPSAYFVKAKIAQINGEIEKAKEYINKAIIFNNKLIKTNLAKSLNVRNLPNMTLEMYEIFALEAYFSSDINSAIRYCRKYLNINPNNVDMSNLLIDLYIKNNELSLAQSVIDKVFENSNNIQTNLYQAKIYELRKDERLENTLLNAHKINPNNADVLLELGNFYLKKGDFLNSKKFFEILVNVNDELFEAYFGYIYSLLETGKTEESMNLIRKFASLNPDSSQIDFLLAKICQKNNELKEALSYLNSAILKAKNPYYFLDRAKINYELKNYSESIDDLKYISNLPNSTVLQNEAEEYIIKNYLKLGDIVNSQMYLNKKLSLDKNRIIYKYNLYVLYKLQGSEKIAESQLKEIKKTKPTGVQDYIDLSEIFFEENQTDNAIKIINKGIKKYPKEFKLYSQKARIYRLLGKINHSKEIFNTIND